MLGRSRIGLAAVLVAALMALGASPTYAASKKTGTITSGDSVTLLNTSGFAKVELICETPPDGGAAIKFTPLAGPITYWVQRFFSGAAVTGLFTAQTDEGAQTGGDKPGHFEWSVSKGSKVAFGEVFVTGTGSGDNDCLYTSQLS